MRAAAAVPAVELTVDGAPLSTAAHAAVASVRVARRLSLPAQCEVSFAVTPSATGTDLAFTVPIGAALAVTVTGDHERLFEGEVTGQEWDHHGDGALEVRVRAYDGLHRLRKRQRVVGRTDVSAASLAEELAADAGLGAKSDQDGPRWPVLVQHRQSDLELLQEVTERAGLWFAVIDGDLRVVTLDGTGEPVDLVLHDTLLAARFVATAEPACRSVRALGWDPVAAGALTGDAGDPRVGRDVAADTGPGTVGADGERYLVDDHGPTADHLEAAAQAELDRRVAGEIIFSGTAEGDARLQPARPVRVTGAHPNVSGTYVLTETVHTLDATGYRVSLSSMPPSRRAPVAPAATIATLGTVTTADDPDGLGRVRVTLPGYADVETDWREVVVPGAGAGKGLVALPDTGDRVLVLLPAGDPAAAIVLGGLYGDGRPDDPGLEGGSVKRWSMLTAGGQRIVLDDDKGRIVVANRDGSAVELAPERVTVHAACDLTIQAPGATMTLRANRIELVQATSPEDGPVPAAVR